jgi:hypothetical protein
MTALLGQLAAPLVLSEDELAVLKISLLTSGLRLSTSAAGQLARLKPQLRTRSGVSGGLDLVLPRHVHVNCATEESYAATSPWQLDWDGKAFVVGTADRLWSRAGIYPRPDYYDHAASDGTPFVEIGQMCSGDRICIGMTRHCFFWRRDLRCRYCSIGHNARREAARKTPSNIAEAVWAAANDSVLPARHVLIGGGTPNNEDRGAQFAAEACRAIKERLAISVYVMIAPPCELGDIDRLKSAGADELGMNVEFFGREAMRRYAPGKLSLIGIEHHYRALERAVEAFGPTNARSIVIVGLEPPDLVVAGAERLAAMGVMPILSPFRGLDGSDLAGSRGFEPDDYVALHKEIVRVCRPYGIVPGPTCIPCQNNTLALPFGPPYRYYGAPCQGVNSWQEPMALA